MTKLRRLLVVFATMLMVGCLLPAAAQDDTLQQYEVELIVFRSLSPTVTQEDWALEEAQARTSQPDTQDTEESPIGAAPPVAATGFESSIQPLESGRFRMSNIEASIKRSRNYQVLTHVGWTQPGFAMDSPRPLAIENITGGVLQNPGTLTGTVSLTRQKYLHLVVDLTYATPEGMHYVLREHRRIRKSGEKHYLDHPYFGVIALVTPR